MHLASISRRRGDDDAFPFTVPAIRSLDRLQLDAWVTFFVGENGSGKSTLLEGIAAAARLPAIGSADLPRDETLTAQRRLGKALRLSWGKKATRGFFLRAEDFFGFTKRLARERAELLMEMKEVSAQYRAQDRSKYAEGLAQGPLAGSLAAMEQRYGWKIESSWIVWLPGLVVGLNVTAQAFAGGLGGGKNNDTGNFGDQEEYFIGLGWRIGPSGLFDFSRKRAAESRLQATRLSEQKIRDEISRQVVEAFARLRSSTDQIAAAKQALTAAEARLLLKDAASDVDSS